MIEGCYREIKYTDTKTNEEYLYTLARRSDNWNAYYFTKYRIINGIRRKNDEDKFTIVTEDWDDIEKITAAPKHYFDYMFKSRTSRLYEVSFEVYKPDEGDTNIRINCKRSSKVYSDDIDTIDNYKSMNFEDAIILCDKEEKRLPSDALLPNTSKKYYVRILVWVEYGKSLDDMKDTISSFINEKLDNDNDNDSE